MLLIIDVSTKLDVNSGELIIVISLYRLRLIKIKVDLVARAYTVNRGKRKKLNLILKNDEKYLLKQIKNNILNKLYYDSVSLYVVLNLIDPKITSDIIGILYILYNISNYWILSKNEDI